MSVVERIKTRLETGPLKSRAWAFQEAILSPRVIFYGKHNCVWIHYQSTPLRPLLEQQWEPPSMLSWLQADVLGLSNYVTSTASFRQDIWRRLIKESSRRQLTDPEDRLLALAGVVSEPNNIWQDEYLAGA